MKLKVVIALKASWNLVNFRAGLIHALVGAVYEVVAVAPADEYSLRLATFGCRYVPLPMDNKGTHPGRDLLLLLRFHQLLRREGYFYPAPIRQMWVEHLSGRRNWMACLWNVLMFQAWLEQENRK